jgi:hypothetical protein
VQAGTTQARWYLPLVLVRPCRRCNSSSVWSCHIFQTAVYLLKLKILANLTRQLSEKVFLFSLLAIPSNDPPN